MVLPFSIGGARVVIPGVYDTLRVAASLPAPVPAGRSVFILGESEEGIPGSDLDLRLNFFTDFQSVKEFYKAGPIVDAARMLFTAQPSPVFGGAIQRLYVWKTNATTRASKALANSYGSIVAARYGEDGNLIKSQVKALAEVGPSKTLSLLPASSASIEVWANGESASLNLTSASTGSAVAASIDSMAAMSVPAVTDVPAMTGVQDIDTLSASGDVLTMTANAALFDTSVKVGDTVVILEGTPLAGPGDENAGVYIVESWSDLSVSIRMVKRVQGAVEKPFIPFFTTGPIASVDGTMMVAFSPISMSMELPAAAGSGSVLALIGIDSVLSVTSLVDWASMGDMLTTSGAAVGMLSAVGDAASLNVSLTGTSWVSTPKAGDVVWIGRDSVLAGPLLENAGIYAVVSATAQSMNLVRSADGAACVNIASVAAAATDVAMSAPGFVGSDLAPKTINSLSEAKVWIDAVNVSTGEAFPTTQVGGTVYLEIGSDVDFPVTLSIDQQRNLSINWGAGSLAIKLGKYKTLQALVDFINTQAGFMARVPDNRFKSLPTTVLDAVDSIPIGFSQPGGYMLGRIKGDYYNFKKLLDDNFGLIAFAPGTARKVGLPAAEAVAAFLTGAVIGSTTDADIQKGLDESLKIDVRMVVPLFSRDAGKDIEDGLTDVASSYQIDSIHAAVRGHVATASGIKVKRERFGLVSIHDSFQNSIDKCSAMSYERMQMAFEMVRAVDGNGSLQWFLPWMASCATAAGRAQASLGTSLLRKALAVSSVKHIGAQSIFSDTLAQDFDPEDQGDLEQAIEAGLLVMRAVQGFGVRVESPDLSTRSRENDPEGWVWERINVLFTLDEVRQTIRTTLENYIGARQSDVSLAVVKEAINKILLPFISGGSLLNAVVDKVVREGVGYRAFVRVTPAEALEFIGLEVLAERAA